VIVRPDATVAEALAVLDAGALGLALVCDGDGRLRGIVTDVDVRKGLLRGMRLEDRAETIMCREPSVVARPSATREDVIALMHRTGIRQVPIVDDDGRVLGVEILKDLTAARARETEVVVMAGGRGDRLRPLTDDLPKPMLPLGGRPVLEHLVERLREQGFVNLTFAIHYKGDVIERYFGSGDKHGVRIRYVREPEQRGTAGALSLLVPRPSAPFVVLNGDLVTDVNFESLVHYHETHEADLTMCVTEYRVELPFGVIDLDGERVVDVREKPGAAYTVNAGIYVLSPGVLDRVEVSGRLDMTDVVRRALAAGARVTCFPLRERWVDIGTQADYRRVADEFERGPGPTERADG
jgi:dTDP-glucose pyrophosphorylase